MNPLTHAQVALDVLSHKKLSPQERDFLIVGSALPDVSNFGISSEARTHSEGLQFFRALPKEYKYLGVGAILHGETPHGLDYYTHHCFYDPHTRYTMYPHDGEEGYIAQKYEAISGILEKYPRKIGFLDRQKLIHDLIEFSFEHLTARLHPKLPHELTEALRRVSMGPSVLAFARHFDVTSRHVRRLRRILSSRHVGTFFSNFATLEGTAHSIENFIFFRSLGEKRNQSHHGFLRHLAQFTRSSLGFLQVKLRDRTLVRILDESVEVVQEDYGSFLQSTTEKLRVMLKTHKIV